MLAFVRASVAAALVMLAALAPNAALAAEKAFQRDDLADGAIKLEAQIKSDAGTVAKPVAALRRDADAAFQRNDFRARHAAARPDRRGGAERQRQLAAARAHHPADPRRPTTTSARCCSNAPRPPPTSPISAPRSRNEEADALAFLGRTFARPQAVAAGARRAAALARTARGRRRARRNTSGCARSTASACSTTRVDADAASPRACFQFSEELPGKRTDFSPFVAVAGTDKPALSVDDKQLCVEGLKHGERYAITLRAGLPSTVQETLSKSADFSIYVRDRKPFVRFSGKAYVLPRTGQRGIPVVSVNTHAVAVEIYRIGDRNLIDTPWHRPRDFQRSLDRYDLDQLERRARRRRCGRASSRSSSTLNADVTTAFPVDQAVGDLAPGVYVMVAQPQADQDADRLRRAGDAVVHRLRSRPHRVFRQ